MTPELLAKVDKLIHDGATVIGFAPEKSPSLTDYPACDKKLAELAGRMWGDGKTTAAKRTIGKGTLFTCTAADTAGMALDSRGYRTPYVKYETIATALAAQGVRPDFESDVPLRYIHRTSNGMEIYMVSNPSNQAVNATCTFRATDTGCSLWDAVQGRIARYRRKPPPTDAPASRCPWKPADLYSSFSHRSPGRHRQHNDPVAETGNRTGSERSLAGAFPGRTGRSGRSHVPYPDGLEQACRPGHPLFQRHRRLHDLVRLT